GELVRASGDAADASIMRETGDLEETIVTSIEQLMRASGTALKEAVEPASNLSGAGFEAALQQLLGRVADLGSGDDAPSLKALADKLGNELTRMGLPDGEAGLAALAQQLTQQLEAGAGALLDGLAEGLEPLAQGLERLTGLLRQVEPDGAAMGTAIQQIGASLEALADSQEQAGLPSLAGMVDELRDDLDALVQRIGDDGTVPKDDLGQFLSGLDGRLGEIRKAVETVANDSLGQGGLPSLEDMVDELRADLDTLVQRVGDDDALTTDDLRQILSGLDGRLVEIRKAVKTAANDSLGQAGMPSLEGMVDELRADFDALVQRIGDDGTLSTDDLRQFLSGLDGRLGEIREVVDSHVAEWASDREGKLPAWLKDLRDALAEVDRQFAQVQSAVEARDGESLPVILPPANEMLAGNRGVRASVRDERAVERTDLGSRDARVSRADFRDERVSESGELNGRPADRAGVDRREGGVPAGDVARDERAGEFRGLNLRDSAREQRAAETMTAGQWLRAREAAGDQGLAPGERQSAPGAGDLFENNTLRKALSVLAGEQAAPKTRMAEAIEQAVQSARQRDEGLSPLRTEQLERSQSLLQGRDLEGGNLALQPGRALDGAGQVRLAPIPVAINHPRFAEAMGQRVTFMVSQNVQQARISLNPANMGPVSVQLEVRGDEAVVHMMAVQGATREALEAALPRLREMLGENGFSQVSVNVGQQGGQGMADSGASGNDGSEAGAAGAAAGGSGEQPGEADQSGLSVTEVKLGDRRLDLFA
ncbi:MAG: flagellar hook-length control protein FliK, partial [Halothiobacillaceae bacterium]